MLKKKSFTVAGWGKKLNGYQYTPDKEGSFPVIVYFHGLGANNVDRFLQEGIFKFIGSTYKPDYIAFAIAGQNAYPPDPAEMKYVLENDPEIAKQWDKKNILWTGLSQGGFSVLECAARGYDGVFIPMSSPAFDANRINGNKTYKAWVFHSMNDGECSLVNVAAAYEKLKPQEFVTPTDGHGNWNSYYDPQSEYGNIYEWAFDSVAADVPPAPSPAEKKLVLTYYSKSGKQHLIFDDDSHQVI